MLTSKSDIITSTMTVAQTATNETVGTQSNGNKWNGKPLSLRIIGTNQGMHEYSKSTDLNDKVLKRN